MRVALVHDWFVVKGGAEKVVHQILECFPNAEVFSLFDFLSPQDRKAILKEKSVTVSFMQKIPFAKKNYRYFFPIFSRAIESISLEGFDLILSSSHAVAKGIKSNKNQIHICYCHTPVRYAWDMKDDYIKMVPASIRNLVSWRLNKLQKWDKENADNVTKYIANSQNISERILNNYNRKSTVVYPPIDTDYFQPNGVVNKKTEPFLVVSRLVPYKRVDLIIKAFNERPDLKLNIIGDGPEFHELKELANENITLLGYQSDERVKFHYQHSRAMLLAAIEDFGITSVEAQACGTPVIALGKGGYKETVVLNETGVFFAEQTKNEILKGLDSFVENESKFDRDKIRAHAEKFRIKRFKEEFMKIVNETIQEKLVSSDS
ncbi:MAG: glycosyltransferase [Salibacteraceae bacterium]